MNSITLAAFPEQVVPQLPFGEVSQTLRLGTQPLIYFNSELRVAGDLLVVGSEATNHHVQIFDLKKLLTITAAQKPKTFSATTDATTWRGLPTGRTHNIVVNAELKYAVSVGSTPRTHTFRSGLVFIDLTNPTAPALLGYNAADGYVHE